MADPASPEPSVASIPQPVSEPVVEVLDARRVRSFAGLVLGRLGPEAFSAVSGVFLALLVAEHTESLFLVTFALTAHRLVTWLAHPIAGRMSDRYETPIGRRVPYMAGGLLLAGVCTAVLTRTNSYWQLLVLLMIARLALVAYSIPAAAVTPETFGGSRWVRALVGVGVGGLVVGLTIRLTVLATWEQNDVRTWDPAYFTAAGYMILAGLVIAILVREAPASRRIARRDSHWKDTTKAVLAVPNAKVLLGGLLFIIAAGGAFDRVYPVYARDVLGAGGDDLAGAGLATVPLSILAFPFGWWLAGRISRKQTGLLAGIVCATGAWAHLWVTELWQSVLIGIVTGAMLAAAGIALAPLYLRILPRGGGLGERFGMTIAPMLVAGMIAAFASSIAYDVFVQDYRVIWLITGMFALAGGLCMLGLRLPPGGERARPMKMWKTLRSLLWQRDRKLFSGEIETRDADGAALLERIQAALDPYAESPPPE